MSLKLKCMLCDEEVHGPLSSVLCVDHLESWHISEEKRAFVLSNAEDRIRLHQKFIDRIKRAESTR